MKKVFFITVCNNCHSTFQQDFSTRFTRITAGLQREKKDEERSKLIVSKALFYNFFRASLMIDFKPSLEEVKTGTTQKEFSKNEETFKTPTLSISAGKIMDLNFRA